jgi:hypothetical protein
MYEIYVMGKSGHDTLTYAPTVETEVDTAQEQFLTLLKRGYSAIGFPTGDTTSVGTVLNCDSRVVDYPAITMIFPVVGG